MNYERAPAASAIRPRYRFISIRCPGRGVRIEVICTLTLTQILGDIERFVTGFAYAAHLVAAVAMFDIGLTVPAESID